MRGTWGGSAVAAFCALAVGLVACVGDLDASPSGTGTGANATCRIKGDKGYMADCGSSAQCGDVMECMASCPTCSDRCQVRCDSDAACAAVGAGTCKAAQCSACERVCSGAPTRCASGGAGGTGTGTIAPPPPPPPSPTSTGTGSTATTCFRHAPYDHYCTFNGYSPRYYDCKPTDTKPSGCTRVTKSPLYGSDGSNISNYGGTTYCCP